MGRLRTLKMLVSVVDLGTLTAAAEYLSTSVPTVVREITKLEAELGVRLLNRTTRSTTPTAEGLQYVQRVRTVLADLQDAEDALQVGQESPQGLLNVTAPLTLGHLHVVPSILRFLAAYPKLQVRMTLLDRVVNLIDEGIDIAVRVGRLPDSTLIAQRIGTMRYVVLASPDYVQRSGTPDRPEDLKDHSCLRFTGAGAGPWTFRDGQRHFDVEVSGRFECNTMPSLLEACVAGFGIARAQSYQAAPYLSGGRLKPILTSFEPGSHEVNLVYPSAVHMSSRLRVLVDWLKDDLRSSLLVAKTD